MSNTSRVDKELFSEEHYLGKPAEDEDRIISRRIEILERYPEFFNTEMTCIEVGCGTGITINRLASRFRQVLGIDIFDYSTQFEISRNKYGAKNSSFRKVDLENESLPEQYDRLISFEVIEHLRNEDSVAAYFGALKPGGMAAISVPNKWWVFETHGANLPLLPWNRVPFFSWLPRKIHEKYANARIYTPGRIINLLEKHGFTVVDFCYVTAPMDVLKDGWVKKMLLRYVFKQTSTEVPMLATSIFVIAQKKSA